jgi:hypothetical protein
MRKELSLVTITLVVLALLMALASWAQQEVPPPGPGQEVAPPAPMVPAAPTAPQAARVHPMETITGKVVAVNRHTPKKPGKLERVILVLQTDRGAVKVLLGPAKYYDQQALKLAPGDQVEIKGVKFSRAKTPTWKAREVKKGDQVWNLRDDTPGRSLYRKAQRHSGVM